MCSSDLGLYLIKQASGVNHMAKAIRLKNPPESPPGERRKSGQILSQHELSSYLWFILRQYFASGSGVKPPFKISVEHIITKTVNLPILISEYPKPSKKSKTGLLRSSKGRKKNP